MITTTNDIISFRIPHVLKEKLDRLAEITKRNKSDLLLHWLDH